MACVGIRLTTYVDQPRGIVVSYSNEKDIPLHLLDSIEENAKKLNVELVVTSRKVSEFLNYCLSRYRVAPKEVVSADHHQKATSSTSEARIVENGNEDKKTVDLLFAASDSPEVIIVGSDRTSNNLPACSDGDELDATDPDLVDKDFTSAGQKSALAKEM
ncbi:hypothetical protein NECAME_02075 [Necator americanus]|uniref:Uncharacterized protein n=1 Tax=Necator americanus TaxID=51031 RepID=W2TI74_NECAM|nr:hypothetical protein NECAME_02075 [Necator americanus]ETN81785.1 hypothetical protein NECAME_02075 [Necator americanus]